MLGTASRQKGYCFDRAMSSQESTNSETYDSDACRTGDNFSLLKENRMILSRTEIGRILACSHINNGAYSRTTYLVFKCARFVISRLPKD